MQMPLRPAMITTAATSRALSQAIGHAKETTESGPVSITRQGKSTHVLLRIEDYRRLVVSRAGSNRERREPKADHD